MWVSLSSHFTKTPDFYKLARQELSRMTRSTSFSSILHIYMYMYVLNAYYRITKKFRNKKLSQISRILEYRESFFAKFPHTAKPCSTLTAFRETLLHDVLRKFFLSRKFLAIQYTVHLVHICTNVHVCTLHFIIVFHGLFMASALYT